MRKYMHHEDEPYENPLEAFDAPMISPGLRRVMLWTFGIVILFAVLFFSTKAAYNYGFENGQRYPTQVKASQCILQVEES